MKKFTHEHMLVVLKEIALNPRSHFNRFYEQKTDGTVTFFLEFDRISLPMSPINIVDDQELAKKMILAVEANINGDMTAAAKEYRAIKAEWADGAMKRNNRDDAYWRKLEADGVVPKFSDRQLEEEWNESPVGNHFIDQSPYKEDERLYAARIDEVNLRAWPGWYARGCRCYTDYIEAIHAEGENLNVASN